MACEPSAQLAAVTAGAGDGIDVGLGPDPSAARATTDLGLGQGLSATQAPLGRRCWVRALEIGGHGLDLPGQRLVDQCVDAGPRLRMLDTG